MESSAELRGFTFNFFYLLHFPASVARSIDGRVQEVYKDILVIFVSDSYSVTPRTFNSVTPFTVACSASGGGVKGNVTDHKQQSWKSEIIQ